MSLFFFILCAFFDFFDSIDFRSIFFIFSGKRLRSAESYKRLPAVWPRNQLLNPKPGIKFESSMLRAHISKSGLQLLQLLLLLAVSLCAVQARWTLRPRRTTSTTTTSTTAMPAQSDRHQHVHHWPPLVAPQAPQSQSQPKPPGLQLLPTLTANKDNTRLIDSFDQRSPDGQHEYR